MESRHNLHIGKERILIRLYLHGGTVLDGSVFLFPEDGPGVWVWTRVLHYFNEPLPYFPFDAKGSGGIVLVTRTSVMRATVLNDETNDEDPALYYVGQTRARFLLTDGTAIEGRVFIDSSPPNIRISDFLCKPERFFHVNDDAGHEILNKSEVPLVYPLPD